MNRTPRACSLSREYSVEVPVRVRIRLSVCVRVRRREYVWALVCHGITSFHRHEHALADAVDVALEVLVPLEGARHDARPLGVREENVAVACTDTLRVKKTWWRSVVVCVCVWMLEYVHVCGHYDVCKRTYTLNVHNVLCVCVRARARAHTHTHTHTLT